MDPLFWILTIVLAIVAVVMVLVILVQRPQGGGLAGAFGGAGGGGSDTVFGGRVGDALTWATVILFVLYISVAIGLNLLPTSSAGNADAANDAAAATQPDSTTPAVPVSTNTTPPVSAPTTSIPIQTTPITPPPAGDGP